MASMNTNIEPIEYVFDQYGFLQQHFQLLVDLYYYRGCAAGRLVSTLVDGSSAEASLVIY